MVNYVGKRLDGRYEIREIISVGEMSIVYKAYDNIDDRTVAVKILKEEFWNNEEFKRRFRNESKAIALLSHENIVKVYYVNFGESLQYFVMEYIDGITLKEYIDKIGAINWNDALYIMTQILRAVQHAHDKGIVHRNIRPQNIILLSNGSLKVTDFGVERYSETNSLTRYSNQYVSPEIVLGNFENEKSDIYAAGVVLYEMLVGALPLQNEPIDTVITSIRSNIKRLKKANQEIPIGLEQICVRATQKDPIDRYENAYEMICDIESVVKNPNIIFKYPSSSFEEKNAENTCDDFLESLIDNSKIFDQSLKESVPFKGFKKNSLFKFF